MTANIRDARIDDVAGIAKVRVETWRAAYDGLVPPEILGRMDIERETARRMEHWDDMHADARCHDLVAVADGEVVGWAMCGPARDPDAPATGEVYAIYAHASRWSRGVGNALLLELELCALERWRTAALAAAKNRGVVPRYDRSFGSAPQARSTSAHSV